jgi:hypothetical protein
MEVTLMSAFSIEVKEIIDNEDGTSTVIFDANGDFQEKVMKLMGWNKWDEEKFQTLFISALEGYLENARTSQR